MFSAGATKSAPIPVPNGQALAVTVGTNTIQVPAGVTSVCAVLVEGGTGGGSGYGTAGKGGNLRYCNNIPVTPLEYLTIEVGAGGASPASGTAGNGTAGGVTQLKRGSAVIFDTNTALGVNGSLTIGGGNGGAGGGIAARSGPHGTCYSGGGGGGAGGYSGSGGAGGSSTSTPGTAGAGGGAGGGGISSYVVDLPNPNGWSCGCTGAPGGGVGLMGQGANGAGGAYTSSSDAPGGGGGSGGNSVAKSDGNVSNSTPGGTYGGGGAGGSQSTIPQSFAGGNGGQGGGRLIWGVGRAFPSTLTGDM